MPCPPPNIQRSLPIKWGSGKNGAKPKVNDNKRKRDNGDFIMGYLIKRLNYT